MNSYQKQLQNLYLGILQNYPEFEQNAEAYFTYDFEAAEWEELKSKYALKSIAKTGTSFEKAKHLLHYLAPRLTHNSFYDNHVESNALQLLSYSFENKEQGINCLNKSKILAECCLALGIYARRVFIYPFSPFDFDSHVVCEIFDEYLNKWIMLDPTMDGYFVDENHVPLSMLEIRTGFLLGYFQTFVSVARRGKDLQKAKLRNANTNLYILKNSFRMSYEQHNGFGKKGDAVCLIPKHYSVCKNETLNLQFRIENTPKEYKHLIDVQKRYFNETHHTEEPTAYTIQSLYASPLEHT